MAGQTTTGFSIFCRCLSCIMPFCTGFSQPLLSWSDSPRLKPGLLACFSPETLFSSSAYHALVTIQVTIHSKNLVRRCLPKFSLLFMVVLDFQEMVHGNISQCFFRKQTQVGHVVCCNWPIKPIRFTNVYLDSGKKFWWKTRSLPWCEDPLKV